MPVLPQALAAQQPQIPDFVDPNAELRRQLQARLEAAGKEQMYTPEQQQQRQQQNDIDYNMGLLASLSGNEQLQGVGGQVLKQAMANQQPKVTEHGTYDPVSGRWSYSPEYKQQLIQSQLDKADASTASYQQAYMQGRILAAERQAARQDQQTFQRQMHDDTLASRPEPLVAVMAPGADGQMNPTLVPRSQAAGMRPVQGGGGGGNPSGDERVAAGFAARMQHATGLLDTFEAAGKPTGMTQVAGGIPVVGKYAQTQAMTTQQQLYQQAAQDWVRAKLRKESGAAIGKDEMADEIRTYFPQPGEGPEMAAQKRAARSIATQAMVAAAGRAGIPGAAPAGHPAAAANDNDPLGLRR